jgi:hypothetical protein
MAGRPGGAAVAIAAWDATNRPDMEKASFIVVSSLPYPPAHLQYSSMQR